MFILTAERNTFQFRLHHATAPQSVEHIKNRELLRIRVEALVIYDRTC